MRWLAALAVAAGLSAILAADDFAVASSQAGTRGAGRENFRLTGPTGRLYSIESFSPASVLVIYFGYSTCWRACPTALNRISEAIDRLGKLGSSIQPVFVDMDPERAVSEAVFLYAASFGPNFLGLTGAPDDIRRAAESFKVDVERIRFSADPTDYAMRHVSPIFVMRPGDAQPRRLPATSSAAAIEAALRHAL